MKPVDYPDNGRGLYVQYHIMREGPNYFLVHYKNTSVLRQDPKDAWRVLGPAKFTAGSQELKQWCLDIHDKYNKKVLEPHIDDSFASEPDDPTKNTKMVT
tara:strand:+ start:4815 stop:5114 length:300 start_codon:yes stop_codon:yes gene_type:complete